MADHDYVKGTVAGTTVMATTKDNTIRLAPEIDEEIRYISRDKSRLLTLVESIRNTKPTGSMKFEWMEQAPIQYKGTLTVAASASATSLTVDDTTFLVANTLVYNPRTHEQFRITSVDSTTTLTVVRAFGNNAAKAMVAGDTLIYTSTAVDEGASRPPTLMRGVSDGELYCQQIVHATGLTDWEAKTMQRGGAEKPRLQKQAIEEFAMKKERAAVLGVPYYSTNGSSMRTSTMAGLRWFCHEKGWQCPQPGVTTYDGICYALHRIAQFGKGAELYGLCGTEVLMKVNRISEFRDNIRTVPEATSLGFDVREILVPGGIRLRLVLHELMDEPGLDREILVTRLSDLRKRSFSPIDIRTGIQDNGDYIDVWSLSEIFGMEHKNTYGCGVISNL